MSPQLVDLFLKAGGETLVMIAASGLATLVFGLPLGVLLAVTAPGGLAPAPALNRVTGAVVNAFRSTPFIILLVALIPFTRLIVGTSIGTTAAIVPLAIAAIPFYARLAEGSFREVDRGLIEAAQAMGARPRQVILKVLVPEALPGLVTGFTIAIVALIGASAMAGAVGGGGLGDLAIRYGYQRFDTTVMVAVIVALIALVSGVQFLGDRLAARLNKRA
jgi:D-methionine transport system permease protein